MSIRVSEGAGSPSSSNNSHQSLREDKTPDPTSQVAQSSLKGTRWADIASTSSEGSNKSHKADTSFRSVSKDTTHQAAQSHFNSSRADDEGSWRSVSKTNHHPSWKGKKSYHQASSYSTNRAAQSSFFNRSSADEAVSWRIHKTVEPNSELRGLGMLLNDIAEDKTLSEDERYEKMKKNYNQFFENHKDLVPNEVIYNIMLKACFNAKRKEEALDWFAVVYEKFPLSVYTVNTMLSGLMKLNDCDEALELYKEVRKRELYQTV